MFDIYMSSSNLFPETVRRGYQMFQNHFVLGRLRLIR